LFLEVALWSAVVTNSWISGNHRAGDEQNDNHDTEFHITPQLNTRLSLRRLVEKTRVLKWERESGVRENMKRGSTADSDGTRDIGVGKNFGSEGFDDCTLAPGIERQTGFPAGLLQESLRTPAMFNRNLG